MRKSEQFSPTNGGVRITDMAARTKVRLVGALRHADRVLLIALAITFLFSVYGIQWGRVEDWNPDQMAMRSLRGWQPGNYTKPPFHTYMNHVLVLWPVSVVEYGGKQLFGKQFTLDGTKLIASRLLVIALSLGMIICAYEFTRRAYGIFAARITALIFATSAGFIALNHFLTCDMPLLFWMILALLFCQGIFLRGTRQDYILAGVCTGLATATKYNGVAVGIAIVVAHFLRSDREELRAKLVSRKLILALLAAPTAFLLANPYALLDWRKFKSDFVYNYTVTPRYEAQAATQHTYLEFLGRIPEVIGYPATWLAVVAIVLAPIGFIARRELASDRAKSFALAASVFLLYFAKIGGFPRIATRYMMPSVPFLLLMAGAVLGTAQTRRKWIYAVCAPVLAYNLICSFYVGKRFMGDPRMAAQEWISHNLRRGDILESSGDSPHWKKLFGLNTAEINAQNPNWKRAIGAEAIDMRLPHVNGRSELFARLFRTKPGIVELAKKNEGEFDGRLFTLAELAKRNPRIVAVQSLDYEVPSEAVRKYYGDMLAGNYPYEIVFDRTTRRPPDWVYPKNIDFLKGRMLILTRKKTAPL